MEIKIHHVKPIAMNDPKTSLIDSLLIWVIVPQHLSVHLKTFLEKVNSRWTFPHASLHHLDGLCISDHTLSDVFLVRLHTNSERARP
jgi:hypothetical protein